MSSIGNLIAGLLAIPAVRLFLEDVFMRVFSEIWSNSHDPEFRKQFLALSGKLSQAKTEEEKRAVLVEIRALRSVVR